MTFKELYSELIFKNIDCYKSDKANQIFVILGQANLFNFENRADGIADLETFPLEKDEQVFTDEWFSRINTTLNQHKAYHLLSFPQFSYLLNYIDPSSFTDRFIVLKDNLRQLFPIDKQDYLEKEENETIELRPDNLPIYQTDQMAVDGKYYYSVNTPVNSFPSLDLFVEAKELNFSTNQNLESIDVGSDFYALDIFVNRCIEQDNFTKQVVVKLYNKQRLNPAILNTLKKLNALLNQFGGTLSLLEETSIRSEYQVGEAIQELFTCYWGEKASFRNIEVYKNPNLSNEITEVSQGLVVETIINEYENSLSGKPCRDLFLTAPTGSGKSLLFQLPAFYVSKKGDVTIVVSPLIALMKDQVNAIVKDRNYAKVAYINSELTLANRERIIESCQSGEIDILYLSPELLLAYEITHFIGSRRLGLLVVDEAHLITTWGRDFRVDYWFLGNHIRKIRKCCPQCFPMVAVTATAIYGGANDMVFDSIDSLVMHNPHLFIGQVKRDDIEFIVSNYEEFPANYESCKVSQTVNFIKKINELGLKTLVYTPFTRHIPQLLDQLNAEQLTIATGYYGTLDAVSKEFAYRQFKSGERKIMIATKAFGMGVDIADIQVVYHHAPSGILPDYVQEIGRVARKAEIKGFATLDYSPQDLCYTKALHQLSALKPYQLRGVLKKIHNSYLQNNKNRNLLLSVDDFGHIFENALDLDQKVLTALMMIEKDYLAKNRFNVLIGRPIKLFGKVVARISDLNLTILANKYANTFRLILNFGNGHNMIELDLGQLWRDHFVQMSFPVLKSDFYNGNIFKDDGIQLIPQLKLSFKRLDNFSSIFQEVQHLLNTVQSIFENSVGYFKQQEFKRKLNNVLYDDEKSEKICRFILSSYAGRLLEPGDLEPNTFLQQRRTLFGFEYRVFGTQYRASFASLLNRLNNLYGHTDSRIVERYVTSKEKNAKIYIRLGYLLEMLELATFEIKGGENPMVFVRLNDPTRIERDANDAGYTNSLLTKTLERHSLSNQIFDHFFTSNLSNLERWNFIEDYFLGADVEALFEHYKGGKAHPIDLIERLKGKDLTKIEVEEHVEEKSTIHIFQPNPDQTYYLVSLLTIEDETSKRTLKVSEWLHEDPKALDLIRRKHKLKICKEAFEILVSKLRANHPEYFKDAIGINALIEFKGYDRPVKAMIPYKNNPVEFYKWWCINQDLVHLTFAEKMMLFDKVLMVDKCAMKKEHKELINKK